MRIALAQMNSTPGDLDNNFNMALAMAHNAKAQGADLIVYNAHFLSGLPLKGLDDYEPFMDSLWMHMDALGAQMPLRALVTCIDRLTNEDGDQFFAPAALLMEDGEIYSLFTEAPFDDEEDDEEARAFEIDGEIFVVMVESAVNENVPFDGVDVVVEMCADAITENEYSPFATGRSQRLKGVSRMGDCYTVYANMVGAADSMVFGGGSCVVDPFGRLMHSCSVSTPELFIFDTHGRKHELQDEASVHMSQDEFSYTALVTATRDYVRKNGFSDVVVGLSGGIDSALVAAIATDALGAEHVHGVLMPGPYSSEGSVSDSLDLARNLGISTVTLPIGEPVEAVHAQLAEACGGEVRGLAAENLQARMRMIYLMTLSNAYGWMVLNTSNKSEAAMGFSTLYGDTCGAYAPLANMYKTRVFDLARWRAAQSPSIPEAIILKPPSAELYPDAKDEDRLPPYDVLDQILQLHIEGGKSATQIAMEGFDADTVSRVLATTKANEYKRAQEPLGPLVEGEPLSGREWPITCGWRDSL